MGTPGQSSGTESAEFPAEDDSSHSGDEESVAGDARDPLPELEVVVDVAPPREAVIRASIRSMDEVDPRALAQL